MTNILDLFFVFGRVASFKSFLGPAFRSNVKKGNSNVGVRLIQHGVTMMVPRSMYTYSAGGPGLRLDLMDACDCLFVPFNCFSYWLNKWNIW